MAESAAAGRRGQQGPGGRGGALWPSSERRADACRSRSRTGIFTAHARDSRKDVKGVGGGETQNPPHPLDEILIK